MKTVSYLKDMVVIPFLLLTCGLASLVHSLSSNLSKLKSNTLYAPDFRGPSPLWMEPDMVVHAFFLMKSCHDVCGKCLIDLLMIKRAEKALRSGSFSPNSSNDAVFAAAKSLFFLPDTVVLSHGMQEGNEDGPVLNYGNAAALHRFSASWEQLTTLPSRYTAEPDARSKRAAFMQKVLENGFVDDYEGVRRSLSGQRFIIKGTTVWNVMVDGGRLGQAAFFSDVEEIE